MKGPQLPTGLQRQAATALAALQAVQAYQVVATMHIEPPVARILSYHTDWPGHADTELVLELSHSPYNWRWTAPAVEQRLMRADYRKKHDVLTA